VPAEKEPFMLIWFGCKYEVADISYEQVDATTYKITIWTVPDVNTYKYDLGELPREFRYEWCENYMKTCQRLVDR